MENVICIRQPPPDDIQWREACRSIVVNYEEGSSARERWAIPIRKR
jgi:hypothetical protein